MTTFDWWSLLGDPDYLREPYPHLEQLRDRGPVQHDPVSGVYFVLGHREFGEVVRSSKLGRDTRLWKDGWTNPARRDADPVAYELFTEFQPQMINSNPPDHRRMRDVYSRAFTPTAVAELTQMFHAESLRLLDAMPDEGELDFMDAYASPMPLRVLRNLFEMPPSMDEQMGRWSAAIIKIGDVMMTAEQKREAFDALLEFKDYLRGHLERRRSDPGDGMIAAVLAAWDDGILDEQETLTNLVAMLIAGHETTVTLIGNGLLALLQNRGELDRLRSDRALLQPALEEFLRFEPGGNMILRIAIEDVEIAGTRIPGGAPCIGLVGAINRDPDVFERPDQLDVGRQPNPHYTFGGGRHLCIGAPMARLETHIAFANLLDRYPSIELVGEHAWRLDRMNARGLGHLPIRVSRTAS
jgi:cytochrome P450